MKKRMTVALTALCLMCLSVAANPDNEDAVFSQDKPEQRQGGSQADVRDLLDAYLNKQKWVEGPNEHNGQTIFVATGIGIISAPPTSADYVNARVNAFDIAMLRAKQAMTESMGQKIQTEAMLAYAEGDLKKLGALGAVDESNPSILDKVITLIHASLDEQLAKRNKQKNQIDSEEIKQIARTSEEFRRLTRTLAQATITGLQAFKVIEHVPQQGQGQIGVVAIYSPRLASMAFALASGTPMAPTTPRAPLAEQITDDTAILMSSYGVSQRINEKGEFVLVAFGQARPATASTQSRLMAERKARAQALGALRSFAGESVQLATDLLEAQTVREYENMTASYSNESAYQETIRTKADSMEIAGVELLRRWSAKQPETGTDICGVVLTWAPSQHTKAKSFQEGMKSNLDRAVNRPTQPGVPSQGVTREGVDGDLDGI